MVSSIRQPPATPVFIPLGSCPPTQHLSRLAAVREPSVYPAWRPLANPVFIPLGSRPQPQCLSRLAAARNPSVYPAWRPSATPVFIPLGGRSRVQDLSRLAAAREPSIRPASSSVVTAPFVQDALYNPAHFCCFMRFICRWNHVGRAVGSPCLWISYCLF